MPFEKIKQMISEQFGVDDDMIDMDTAFAEISMLTHLIS